MLARAKVDGYFSAKPDYLDDPDEAQWKRAYDWMRTIMGEQIEGYTGEYPLWGWSRRPNPRKAVRCLEPHSLVVADVPRGRMVISDFGLWHCALNNWFATSTEAEWDSHDRDEPDQAAKEESWRKVLDITDRTDPDVRAWVGTTCDPQLCIDRIYPHEVVSITPWRALRSR